MNFIVIVPVLFYFSRDRYCISLACLSGVFCSISGHRDEIDGWAGRQTARFTQLLYHPAVESNHFRALLISGMNSVLCQAPPA